MILQVALRHTIYFNIRVHWGCVGYFSTSACHRFSHNKLCTHFSGIISGEIIWFFHLILKVLIKYIWEYIMYITRMCSNAQQFQNFTTNLKREKIWQQNRVYSNSSQEKVLHLGLVTLISFFLLHLWKLVLIIFFQSYSL